ncbi:MAG: hypothetical protein U1E26_11420 [Coriobacteriia bacterium]|nr:hypothetical protein [Coriobacteriia bacterium]
MGIARSGVLLMVPLALMTSATAGCEGASQPWETAASVGSAGASAAATSGGPGTTSATAVTAETTVTAPFQIPVIELRGTERPDASVRLRKGRLTLPQGDVTAAVGCMAGSPLEVPQGDLREVIGAIESASMKPGTDDTRVSQLDSYLYLDADIGGGEHSVIDLRFGAGDAVLLTNYGYSSGPSTDAAVYYQTRSPRLAQLLRDAVSYRQWNRAALREAESATLLERGSTVRHALTTEEAARVKAAVLRAELASEYSHQRTDYGCVFEFALPGGEKETVTYDIGAGRLGLGTDLYELDTADRLALKSLIGTRVNADKVQTEITKSDGRYRQ